MPVCIAVLAPLNIVSSMKEIRTSSRPAMRQCGMNVSCPAAPSSGATSRGSLLRCRDWRAKIICCDSCEPASLNHWHSYPSRLQCLQVGRSSSHLRLRSLQLMHPLRDRNLSLPGSVTLRTWSMAIQTLSVCVSRMREQQIVPGTSKDRRAEQKSSIVTAPGDGLAQNRQGQDLSTENRYAVACTRCSDVGCESE